MVLISLCFPRELLMSFEALYQLILKGYLNTNSSRKSSLITYPLFIPIQANILFMYTFNNNNNNTTSPLSRELINIV